MFKIYQIHEKGGEHAYRLDHIVGSYLHKEKAERELEKFRAALSERYAYYQKCSNCSAQFGCSASKIDRIREKCDRFSAEDEDDESFVGFCKNAVCSYDRDTRYRIEEVNVDEDEE